MSRSSPPRPPRPPRRPSLVGRRLATAALLPTLAVALAACAGVLGIRPKPPGRAFEHHAHSVKGVSCLACHDGVARAQDTGPLHLPETAKCLSCHARPHDPRPCGGCHGRDETRAAAALARQHLRFSHERHVSTLGGQCVPCHAAAGATSQPALRPPMAQCFTCHAHEGQWRARDCDGCHVDLPREAARPASHVIHEGDFVREHGVRAAAGRDLCATCHSERSCAACHGATTAALPWRFSFDKPSLSGLHRAGFRLRHADEARANPGLCTTCHEQSGDGARFCRDCHVERRVSSGGATGAVRSPHPAGWVRARGGEHGRAARVDPASCAGCHGGAGEALCVGCHRVGGPGGNPHGRGYASALDPLRDRPCQACHAP